MSAADELLKACQRLVADMVLDALGIGRRDGFADAQLAEEGEYDLVPLLRFTGQLPAFTRQSDRAVGLGRDQSGILQPRQRCWARSAPRQCPFCSSKSAIASK